MKKGTTFRCLLMVISKNAFGANYFRDIYSSINRTWYKRSWKEFVQLKNIDAKFYA